MKQVGLIGRTNVGKSTLFNRLVGTRKAVVSNIAGTTRDFLEGVVLFGNKSFQLVDFGGIDFGAKGKIEKEVQKKVLENIDQLDLIIFTTDGNTDISRQDQKIADFLRKKKKPVILVVNKIDHEKRKNKAYEFYSLGFEKTLFVSAVHNKGIDDLLEEISQQLKLTIPHRSQENFFKIAIIGRPNVGKSSLFNFLLKKNRSIVSDIAGTTRDAIDTDVNIEGEKYTFIDTAGLKRKTKIAKGLDKVFSYEAINSIKRADLVLYMIDASEYIVSYDVNLLNFIFSEGKGVIIVVNKWDLKKSQISESQYRKTLCTDNSLFKKTPIIFTSVLGGYGMEKIFLAIQKIRKIAEKRINTSVINKEIRKISESIKGVQGKIFYATQTKSFPCEILLFVKRKDQFKKRQLDFIEAKIREKFGLYGITIKLTVREREH